ncbi:MAG TPA: triose-phosphate isomerase [Acidobacteriota bacterium]|nr:triose-phosphate isomerase [Acidobacteriota bacterium]
MRRSIIAGNWKMHKTRRESVDFVRALDVLIGRGPKPEVLVFPPFTALADVRQAAAGTSIGLGAQNVHPEDQGAYTGEISAAMLEDCGCSHVLIGHSERRQLFGEDDELLNRKLRKICTTSLIPVLCVGEQLDEREGGRSQEVVLKQLERGCDGLTGQEISRIIVAYEPVWAIGTGKTATPEIAQEMHAAIRGWFDDRFSSNVAEGLRILYGGSVKPDNASGLMEKPDIDGALVGGASLQADSFAGIVAYDSKA